MIYLKLLQLQFKSLFRSAQFKTELGMTIFKMFFGLYLLLILVGFGSGVYFFCEQFFPTQKPFQVICGLFIFYWLYDLTFRFMLSSLPVVSIKPLLILNLDRDKIVKYALAKGYFNFFNFMHFFLLIPLVVVLIVQDFGIVSSIFWGISMWILLSCNSYLNLFLNKTDKFFYPFIAVVSIVLFAYFKGWIDILPYTTPIFYFFYENIFGVILAVLLLLVLIVISYKFYFKELYLDKGLEKSASEVKSINLPFLNKLGSVGTFIKNDLYLIIRNKRPRTVIITSILFVFYPFFFIFSESQNFMAVFGAIFATGGFMMSFGQFIPSWDSAYYPLFMTQNVKYHNYLLSKWYIIVFSILVSLVLCTFYLFIDFKFYFFILAVAIYNIGINVNLVLLMGSFMRQPIDLSTNKGAFGNTKSFNANTFILSFIMMLVPMAIVLPLQYIFSQTVALLTLAFIGIIGLFFRKFFFNKIVSIYHKNKYSTLKDFKQ